MIKEDYWLALALAWEAGDSETDDEHPEPEQQNTWTPWTGRTLKCPAAAQNLSDPQVRGLRRERVS